MVSARLVVLLLLASASLLEASQLSAHKGKSHKGKRHNVVLKRLGQLTPAGKGGNPQTALIATSEPAGSATVADVDDDAPEGTAAEDYDVPGQSPPLLGKLKTILMELKERRENGMHLEASLKQLDGMIKESRKMHRVASTKKGKSTYLKQAKDTEEIYRNTYELYTSSRAEASGAAKELESEMKQAQIVEDQIIEEAKTQLKHYAESQVKSALDKSDDDGDDAKHEEGSFLSKKTVSGKTADDDKDDDEEEDDDDDDGKDSE